MSYRIYTTKGIVLKKRSSGEQNSLLYILTKDLGLVIASARSTRLSKSKLKGLMEEYSYGEYSLVRGKNGWRLTNAASNGNFFFESKDYSKKTIAQLSSVLIKMIQGEIEQGDIYESVFEAFNFLLKTEKQNTYLVEILAVLRIMNLLGYVDEKEGIEDLVSNIYMDQEILNKVSINKIKIVGIVNKAIRESQL